MLEEFWFARKKYYEKNSGITTGKRWAYDYYIAGNEDTESFEKIFLVDDIVEEICKPDKYFLIGEKGSGKTAYSVYMSKSDKINSFCFHSTCRKYALSEIS